MILTLTQVCARAWRGYKHVIDHRLPRRMSWLEPKAADAFARMNDDAGDLIEYTDVYRSVLFQIQCIKGADERKRRLYAPPTKSGHNFGMSIDVAIDETLQNFTRSGKTTLIVAGRDRQALGRWMQVYGWTGIEKERWHFDFADGHKSVLARINDVYGPQMTLTNDGVQVALNILLGAHLTVDGILGPQTAAAAKKADKILGVEDNGDFSPWFRRLLAGATATIKEV